MNIIYKSDKFKHLVKIIYIKYYFEEENLVQDFWNNSIIFVLFKIDKISSFSHKDSFKIFFSIYKIRNFQLEIKDPIFTLGFPRVIIHEYFGHLIVTYIFYIFHVYINDYDSFLTPRMNKQIEGLNKKNM